MTLTDSKIDRKQNFDCGSLVLALPSVKIFGMNRKPSKRPRYFKERRLANNLTLDQLSERSGLSVSMISLLERGLRDYSEDTLAALAESLGCEIGDLFRPPSPVKNELAEYVMRLDAKQQGRALKLMKSAFEDEAEEMPKSAKKR